MQSAARTFEDTEAIRAATQVLIGLVGPSGGGKTFSALRLATGIQRITGGDIHLIDTEARRSLHYADSFKFRHTEFKAPFGPLDYLAAIEHCVSRGAKIIIVDSASHEHEGPGGVLEMHGTELDRLAGNDYGKRDRFNLLAWQKPKSERRRLINSILQMPVNFIFCFRAKDKTKPGKDNTGKSTMISLGWMPIAGEEFVYEMTVNMLLYPGSNGVPLWQPEETGEKAMIKLPAQFRQIFEERQPLSEQIGEQLAAWAAGGSQPSQSATRPATSQPRPPAQAPEQSSETPNCPKCNGAMKLKPAGVSQAGKSYGAFWSCSSYPKCNGNMKDSDWQKVIVPVLDPPFELGGDHGVQHQDD